MYNLFKKVGKFETHHRILAFSIIFIGTIFCLRYFVQFYNPNPVFFNIELHHFDYGVMLLLVTVKLLLFGSRKYDNFYLLLAAIGSGFIVDGYLALRLSVVENHDIQVQVYNSTMTEVVITVIVSTLVILFINSIRKR
jgi:hypothetical protein